MITIAYTITTKPNADGAYIIRYNAVSDDPRIESRRGEVPYKPRTKIRDNNELRHKANSALGVSIGRTMRGDTDNVIYLRCINPKSDFMTKKELIASRGYKFYGPRKKADVLAAMKKEKAEPAKEPACQTKPGERAYEVVAVKNPMTGATTWTIARSTRIMLTEQEAKETLFKLQMEALSN